MNEQKIKELALKANMPGYVVEYGTELCLLPHLKQFAELIVRESMKVTKDYTCNQGWDYSAPVALARHFGVGE